MLRTLVSVRFPAELAEALDRLAQRHGYSRSDLVETLIGAVEVQDREAIVKTPVIGAPTEKLNLRLRAETVQQVKQLAGDLRPSDFLRRAVAHIVGAVPPAERHEGTPSGNGHRPPSPLRRRPRGRPTAGADIDLGTTQGASIGLLIAPVLIAIGALISLIVWLLCRRSDPPPQGPGNDARGQLADGPPEEPTA